MSDDEIKLAFERWWSDLTDYQRSHLDRSSCWLGFLGGASWGVGHVGNMAKEIFQPEAAK